MATAKAWVQARFSPSADRFLTMLFESDELRAELIRRLEAHGYANTKMENAAGEVASLEGSDSGQAGGRAASADAAVTR